MRGFPGRPLRVLFVGGTRFVGPHAVREVAAAGRDVTVFHRGEHEPDLPAGVRHVHGDVANFEAHVDELRALEPDVVVDMIAFTGADVARVRAFESRAVVVSSGDVYRAFGRLHRTEPGDPDPVPLTEDSPLRAKVIDPAYDKTAVEEEARELGATILRFPAVHGPGDSQHRLYEYVKRMDDGRPAILLDEASARWRWVRGYCEDVGHAVALATIDERAAGHTYNVAEPVAYAEAEWVRLIAGVVGWEGELVALPSSKLPEPLRSDAYDLRQDFVVDSTRIRDELGYAEVVPQREALRRTIEWERANPPEKTRIDYAAEDAVLAQR